MNPDNNSNTFTFNGSVSGLGIGSNAIGIQNSIYQKYDRNRENIPSEETNIQNTCIKTMLVGVDKYSENQTCLKELKCCLNDIELLSNIFKKIGIKIIKKEKNVKIIEFFNSIDSFIEICNSGEEMTGIIFHFSGHSTIIDNKLHLAFKDSNIKHYSHTMMSYELLIEKLKKIKFKYTIIILDCCESGGGRNTRAVYKKIIEKMPENFKSIGIIISFIVLALL